MGIIPFFIGAKLTTFFIKSISIPKDRLKIKEFEPFEDSSKNPSMINVILISYGCLLKRSSKPLMKGSRVESIEEARKEYKKLLEEGWKKTYRYNSYY